MEVSVHWLSAGAWWRRIAYLQLTRVTFIINIPQRCRVMTDDWSWVDRSGDVSECEFLGSRKFCWVMVPRATWWKDLLEKSHLRAENFLIDAQIHWPSLCSHRVDDQGWTIIGQVSLWQHQRCIESGTGLTGSWMQQYLFMTQRICETETSEKWNNNKAKTDNIT